MSLPRRLPMITLLLISEMLVSCTWFSTRAPLAATPAPRSAMLSELMQEVQAKQNVEASWQAAVEGQLIVESGGVKTGANSRARLDISDGSLIRLGDHTVFTLTKLTPEATDPVTRLKLEGGKLWIAVTKTLGGGSFEIETPEGVATVRGSWIGVSYVPDRSEVTVTCLEGTCRLTSASGQATDLTGGQQSEILGHAQAPTLAHAIEAPRLQDWEQNVPEVQSILPAITPAPAATLAPTETPEPCAGATDPGARERFTLEQITPCLDTVPKVSAFIQNNVQMADVDSPLCGGVCYTPAQVVYQNGADDLHGIVTLECYLLEKNGQEAYHIGLSIEDRVGTNVCGVNISGSILILEADGETAGSFNSLAEVARHYISLGRMKSGGQLRTIKASQITEVVKDIAILDLPWVLHSY